MGRNRESAVRDDLQKQAAIPVFNKDSYPNNIDAAAGQHTSDVVIMGVVEKGERCGLGDGIPLR